MTDFVFAAQDRAPMVAWVKRSAVPGVRQLENLGQREPARLLTPHAWGCDPLHCDSPLAWIGRRIRDYKRVSGLCVCNFGV